MTRSLTLFSLALYVAMGQTFEVASIKPAPPTGGAIGLFTYPGGRIVASNYTLSMLIHEAYGLEMFQILGVPHWAESDRYNIEAKPPASSASSKWVPPNFKTPPNPEMQQMLQTLLADRFQLKVHKETKKDSVYALLVAKGGPKLKAPTTTKQPFVSFGRTGSIERAPVSSLLTGQNATMALFAARLTVIMRHPVLDRTGLPGNFDFEVEYAGDETESNAAPFLSEGLRQQLGLKLEKEAGTSDVLVVDHAEKPSLN